ncbi:MAG: hypothetical protein D3910_18230, partial [Candidatus Electrothrix sp. ATG2]|nr:hypothetical protein [Candidatus Electrothrix sp. ATG2]
NMVNMVRRKRGDRARGCFRAENRAGLQRISLYFLLFTILTKLTIPDQILVRKNPSEDII